MRKLLFIAVALVSTGLTQSGDLQPAIPEPDQPESFYGLEAGRLIPLEHQAVTVRGHAGGFIAVKSQATMEFKGARSPVRFHAAPVLEFVVKPYMGVDPGTAYNLRKLDSKKKIREVVISSGHASPFGASMTVNTSQGVLPADFSRHGTSSFKMSASNLPPGEYAVGRIGGQSAFCFGVD